MKTTKSLILIAGVFLLTFCTKKIKVEYPVAETVDTVTNYHGTEVADPYRWMEDLNSEMTQNWITEQNKLTNGYLEHIDFQDKLKERLTELWDYEKYSAPSKQGKYYFFSKNDGLQEQSVVYYQEGLDGEPSVFLDPNTFSDDGSISLAGMSYSKDHKYVAYAISKGGSDWREIYTMEIEGNKKLDDKIEWAKFTGMSWYKDGFYYSRYDEPNEENKLKSVNEYQKLYYHKLGTPQSEDRLVMENPDNPKQGYWGWATDDERFLIINIWEGSSNYNLLSYKDLKNGRGIRPIVTQSEARYSVIDNVGDKLLIQTDFEAPNGKVILIDPAKPAKSNWEEVIPESENPIDGVSFVGGKLFVVYLKDANSQVVAFDQNGSKLFDVELPGIGTVSGFGGNKNDKELFYSYTSFTYPSTIFKYDVEKNESELFRKSNVKFDMGGYETKQVFVESNDGTKIPLFITHKKGLELDGNNPTLLYAYGGFNIAMQPSFRLTTIPILENGGVYAMACLRGGSEYGEDWHKAGMLEKKQNVFDDFISCAEYLVDEKYTSPEKLAAQGGSNGGLLVGAVINQRPDLFKVAFPAVGVMDMLRFHKFTIGWAWVPEYGSSDDPNQFEFLYKYSPLHNIKKGTCYPATMVTTADHDDRVFPAHSFKYAQTLQDAQSCDNPTLIRIETKVGHGAGTSTSKTIDLYSCMWAFMFFNMGVSPY
ncbi:MAG: prolyl oligopeptidase family serine peptidase [Melioribacteraceae bacterium]|nr:prolyl oligopeptidase family serine peptidase [Melioribacteraceae bacterium]